MKNHEPTRRGCGESHRSLQSQPGFFSPNGAAIPPARANGPGAGSNRNVQPQRGDRSSAVLCISFRRMTAPLGLSDQL